MSLDQDVFSEQQTDQSNNGNNNVAADDVLSVFADKLLEIKNENGQPKYDSIEKALDALKASQEHIRRLEQEAAERNNNLSSLEEKARKAEELEEVIRRLSEQNNNQTERQPPSTEGLNEQQIADLVRRELEAARQTDTAVNNLKRVDQAIRDKFGDGANTAVKQKAQELGVSLEELKQLSATKPNLVLSLFGDKTSTINPTTPGTGIPPRNTSEPLKRPEKSLIAGAGANDKNRVEFLRKIREEVYRKHGVTE